MIQERRHGAADAMPPLIHASHCVSDDIVLQLEISQQPSPPQVLLQTNLHSAAGSNSFGPAGDEPMASALLGPLLSLSYVRPLTASVNANCGLSSQFPVIHGAREAIAASFPQQVQTMETSTPVYGGATEEFSQPACLHSEDLENARAAADIEKGLQAVSAAISNQQPAQGFVVRVPAGLVLSCSSSPGLEIPLLTLGKTLVLPLQKKDILKAPVVILQCSRQLSIYFTVEQVFKADFLSGADRFWKLVRHSYDPPLETWRPRVNGQQLKALSKVRLPDTDEEWQRLSQVLHDLQSYLRQDTDPLDALRLFKEQRSLVEDVWTDRKKDSRDANVKKRPLSDLGHSCRQERKISNSDNCNCMTSGGESDQDKSSNSPTQQPLLQKEGSVPMLFLGGKNEGHPPQDILLESFMRKQHDFLLTDRDHHSASHVAENGTCQRNGYFHFMDQQVAPCGAVPSSNVQPVVQNPSLMRIQSSAGPLASDSTAVQMPRDGLGTGFLSIKSFSAVALPGLGSNAPHRSCPDDSPLQHRLTAAIGESEQGQKDHVVVLNVGGTRFWTTFFTVNSVEGSFLAEHCCNHWWLGNERDSTGTDSTRHNPEVFIDRDGTHFRFVLNFLRFMRERKQSAQQLEMSSLDCMSAAIPLPSNLEVLEELRSEAIFYRLPQLEQAVNSKLEKANNDKWETLFFEARFCTQLHNQVQLPAAAQHQLEEKQRQGFRIVQMTPSIHQVTCGRCNSDPSFGTDLVKAQWLVTLHKPGHVDGYAYLTARNYS